jgi:hypothetical protein
LQHITIFDEATMFVSLILGGFFAGLALAACPRSALQITLDGFFQSAFDRSSGTISVSPALSQDVKIIQNNLILKSLEDSAWGNTTSFYRKWRISAIDTETCEIACYCLLNQKSGSGKQLPAIMGIRIRKEVNSNHIREVEMINLLDGGPGILSGMFRPDNNDTYSDSAEAFWLSPQNVSISRAELIRIANTYPDGIQAGDGANIPIGDVCPRWENGVQTAGGSKIFKNTTQPRYCRDGLDEFKQPVEYRRWVADTETGVVLGLFYFSHRKTPLVDAFDKEWGNWLNEFFKIQNGKITGIHAIMLFVRDKKDIKSGVPKSEWVPVWT